METIDKPLSFDDFIDDFLHIKDMLKEIRDDMRAFVFKGAKASRCLLDLFDMEKLNEIKYDVLSEKDLEKAEAVFDEIFQKL